MKINHLALLLALTLANLANAQGPGIGTWEGSLDAGGTKLRILFTITQADETYTATMSSPDQGALDLPVTTVSIDGNRIVLTMKQMGGTYEGIIDEDGNAITGTWSQGAAKLPLDMLPSDGIEPPNRPQEPKPPYPYQTEEVSFENPKAQDVTLGGTLAIPKGAGPHPAVLFITGSGPQDRDEALMGHKPFLVIADYLTRQGFATLRVDDRGVGASTGDFATATTFDFAKDTHAGVAYLKTRSEIDSSRIGLLGHSEGGLIAPLVATETDDVAFIVLLAGPAATGLEVILLQSEMILQTQGLPESMIEQISDVNRSVYALASEKGESAKLESDIRAALDAAPDFIKPSIVVDSVIEQVTSPWFGAFLAHDPVPVLQKITCPVLALFGEKDIQVPPSQSLNEMKRALNANENPDNVVLELPGLNHLFQTCTTGLPSEYGRIEETIAPVALTTIGDWLTKHTAR